MAEPFRTRSFVPVEASKRPVRTRRGVRIVVTDGTQVLLVADTDPGIPGSRWLGTPGGGIDPGESPLDAARRELFEETGLTIEASELVGPVMHRVVTHGYSDQILVQDELFYVLHMPRFDVVPGALTEDEKLTLDGFHWLALDALADAADPVWPLEIPQLIELADAGEPVWEMGNVEESMTPVDGPLPPAPRPAG